MVRSQRLIFIVAAILLISEAISYARVLSSYGRVITISDPKITSYMVEDLAAGRWYFAISAYDSDGHSSGYSGEIMKNIEGDNGRALLSWTPPTHNIDGSRLTNLAGFRIHYAQDTIAPSRGRW